MDNGTFGAPIRDISDGLSHTAAVSEWLRFPVGSAIREPDRSVYATPVPMLGASRLDAFSESCRRLDPNSASLDPDRGKGIRWDLAGFGNSTYNHVLEPNERTCTNGGQVAQGAWTAGSRHPGGANCLFADGHVAFVKDSIASATWRALGTRAGGEVVSSGDD